MKENILAANFDLDKKIDEVYKYINKCSGNINSKGVNLQNEIYELIHHVHSFMNDCNTTYLKQSEKLKVFNMSDNDKNKVSEKIIRPFLSLLKDISEKCIDCETDCYLRTQNKNTLDVLRYIMLWVPNYFLDSNDKSSSEIVGNDMSSDIYQQCFNIWKNIMNHKKNLLLKAVQEHKIKFGFSNTNLKTTLVNILSANVSFSDVFKTKEAHEFLELFYDETFDELIRILNESYTIKDEGMNKISSDHGGAEIPYKQTIGYQYECQLMGVLFLAISKNIHNKDRYAAYTIGNLFIDKYYCNQNDNQKYLFIPYLMLFIQDKFNDDVLTRDSKYFQRKLKLIQGRINILKKDSVKKIDPQYISYYKKNKNGKYKYGYFGFTPDKFFGISNGEAIDSTDQIAEKFRLNMDYVISIEDALIHAWRDCNKLFCKYRQEYTNDKDSQEKFKRYKNIEKDRMDIYNMFRELAAEKQKLLKERLVYLITKDFHQLSKIEKILRAFFLILTWPIQAVIFICVKTLRKFFHCFKLSFEVVLRLYASFQGPGTCKDVWAESCESYLDGLEINNNEKINARIRRYETKNWLLARRILFPIDLVVHIIIGVFVAIKKFFTSIKKYFETFGQIWQDIWDDDACSHMFKTEGVDENKSEVICNPNYNISVLPTGNIKVRNKFIDMSCPRVPYYDFSKKPKSIWDHIQCVTGFKSIKSAKKYDRYAHEHSGTPRLRYKEK